MIRNKLFKFSVLSTACTWLVGCTSGCTSLLTKADRKLSGRHASVEHSAKLKFSDHTWIIKNSTDPVGPGPNYFSDSNVSIDSNRWMHLKIKNNPELNRWTTSEAILDRALGYGKYTFHITIENKHSWNSNFVFGAFTWDDLDDKKIKNENREIDFEISDWGIPGNASLQFAVQPVPDEGDRVEKTENLRRFDIDWKENQDLIYTLVWKPEEILFALETPPNASQPGKKVEYKYRGELNPNPGNAKIHLNFWIFHRRPLIQSLSESEVIIKDFSFNSSPS